MRIWYHGTNREGAKAIMDEGFRSLTYFARHLEDALEFGGLHVFGVALPEDNEDWQMRLERSVGVEDIVFHKQYQKPKVHFENEELREKIFELNSS